MEGERSSELPARLCIVCGREFRSSYSHAKTCSTTCSAERVLERARTRNALQRRGPNPEPHIQPNGSGSYQVKMVVDGQLWFSTQPTIEKAREERDWMLREREKRRLKRCPICSTAFRAKRANRVYCSESCGVKARAQGVLVKPARALPSTRRRAKQIGKQQAAERMAKHTGRSMAQMGTLKDKETAA